MVLLTAYTIIHTFSTGHIALLPKHPTMLVKPSLPAHLSPPYCLACHACACTEPAGVLVQANSSQVHEDHRRAPISLPKVTRRPLSILVGRMVQSMQTLSLPLSDLVW
jgi:hypothetical protein